MTASLQATTQPITYAYAARYGSGGRVSLPVAASQVYYANFKHVMGSPAPEGQAALSIDRLKVLDTLIDRLQAVKEEPLAAREASPDLSTRRVDALIQQYGAELHALASAPAVPYAPRPSVESGMLFNLAA